MKLIELRKGNYVLYEKQISRVLGFVFNEVIVEHKPFNDTSSVRRIHVSPKILKPVPFSEGWFSEPVFQYSGDCDGIRYFQVEINGIYFYADSSNDFSTLEAHKKCNMPKLKYVHRLQNLYYELTNSEILIDIKNGKTN